MNTFFADPARYNLSDLVDHILIMQTDYSWPKEDRTTIDCCVRGTQIPNPFSPLFSFLRNPILYVACVYT